MTGLAQALLAELDDDALDELATLLAPRLQRRFQTMAADTAGWLDTRKAAEYLGLSKHAMHRLSAERRVPFSQDRPGARCYFRRTDLDAWRERASRGTR